MSKQSQRLITIGTLLVVGIVSGCGQKELAKKEAHPVSGKVVYKGEPVRFVLIELQPEDRQQGIPAEGKTGADGAFSLRTYSNEEPDGAVPGTYKVSFHKWDPVEAGPLPKGAVATEITDEMKAGVVVEIKAEDSEVEINIP